MITTKRTSIINGVDGIKHADNLIILDHKAFWEPECLVLTIIYVQGGKHDS